MVGSFQRRAAKPHGSRDKYVVISMAVSSGRREESTVARSGGLYVCVRNAFLWIIRWRIPSDRTCIACH